MYEVTMPKLSDSMEDGKIIEWKVKEGDAVREGDVLAEIESDKAVLELECFHDGVVAQIKHGNGGEVRVGDVIAIIADAGEAPAGKTPESAEREAAAVPAAAAAATPPPAAVEEAPRHRVPPAKTRKTGAARPAREQGPAPPPAPAGAGRPSISPYARKLAEERGVDYATVRGTGPGGRIVAADIEQAAREQPIGKPPAAEKAPPAPPREPIADGELPPLELVPGEADVEEAPFRLRTQARRVTDVKHVVPHFYLTRAADVTALMSRKAELKDRSGATVTHVIILASLKALQEHPEINRSYDHGKIIKWKGVHLGLAVDTGQGLTVAVLHDAQGLSFEELVRRSNELVERARSGRLSADERRHASFTISNLGMYDVEHFEPIINPPSAVTLGVSTALPQAIVRNDEIHIGKVMRLTASCDHRIVDGAAAARFLATLAALLEHADDLLKGA